MTTRADKRKLMAQQRVEQAAQQLLLIHHLDPRFADAYNEYVDAKEARRTTEDKMSS